MLNKLPNLNALTLAMAVIGWLLAYLFRSTGNGIDNWLAWLQPICSILLAISLYLRTRGSLTTQQSGWQMIPWIVACAVLPFGIEILQRLGGSGDPWEVLSVLVFANWTLCLAALSRFRRFQNLTAIFAGAIVNVVISMVDGWQFSLLAASYMICLLWWSMTSYWQRLEQKFANAHQNELSIKAGVFVVCGVGVLLMGGILLLFASTTRLDLAGISWFSGGSRWSDDFARDGVGEGNGIRAATKQAHTFGPVDSDVFMDSTQPTLFDVATDMYGPPMKRRPGLAVPLAAEFLRHNHDRVAKNQRVSAEFSTVRKSSGRKSKAPQDEVSDVLFYVKGQVPLLLALETYNHFADGVWQQIEPSHIGQTESVSDSLLAVSMVSRIGKPWMEIRQHRPNSIYAAWEYAAVKIINFQSTRIPAAPCLEQLYIDKVDRPDFFAVGWDGIPRLNNESPYIPDMTIIHLLSSGINLYQAKTAPAKLESVLAQNLQTVEPYLAPTALSGEATELAQQWTLGLTSKWSKVEAIVQQLRHNFEFNVQAELPSAEADIVESLLNQRGGTDYMFATTAALMLRSQQIPARVVSGFLAKPARHDRKSGHTAVLPTDIHVWVEVSLDGEFWIPVEPTPGFPQPRYHLTPVQRVMLLCYSLRDWVLRHPSLAAAMMLLLAILIRNYRWLTNQLQTIRWIVISWLTPDRMLLASSRLIDQRSTLAGLRRPIAMTPAMFSKLLADQGAPNDSDQQIMARYSAALNRELYHPAQTPHTAQSQQLIWQDCRAIVSKFGLRYLREIKIRLNQGNRIDD